ncbi:hypothetical protein RGU12_09825 [Fredinandcohnia sp. QZ13]|uniref:hypothetical protein n=1 Tax=Fredinandcohnia sp. QZ13 TaxID=3073144 RepID=UPI0028532BCD|nr:hypothetical protein [Fredinandcohnia sp. QZ13]MDR4887844.1 hypothetical protein [Fredinandcohnia sp. QZ13]
MKKVVILVLSLVLIQVLFFGCKPKENISTETTIHSPSKSEKNNQLGINNNFIRVSFSKPKGTSKVNFDDRETLNAFGDIFSSAVKEDGIVNMADPEFYMDVVYEKKNQLILYLWIGEKGEKSTFMKADDTNTIYTVSPETTDRLSELIKNTFN